MKNMLTQEEALTFMQFLLVIIGFFLLIFGLQYVFGADNNTFVYSPCASVCLEQSNYTSYIETGGEYCICIDSSRSKHYVMSINRTVYQ